VIFGGSCEHDFTSLCSEIAGVFPGYGLSLGLVSWNELKEKKL